MFSLFKLASIALTPDQELELRTKYRSVKVDVRECCKVLCDFIKSIETSQFSNPLDDRRRMFGKMQPSFLLTYKVLHSAVKFGHVDCLMMAREIGYPLHMTDEELEGEGGFRRELRSTDVDWTQSISSKAAYYGNQQCLEYAIKEGLPWDVSTCTAAVLSDNYDILKYAIENGCPLDKSNPADAAAINGNLPILQYLHKCGCPWSVTTCANAAMEGHLECLKYLQANGCPWDVSTCIEAVENENIDCLKFAVENGCPLNASGPADQAAAEGNLSLLKYLHEHGCPLSVDTCAAAVADLECLKYLRANGCPWDVSTCSEAVEQDEIDCLKFAVENGCPLDEPGPANTAANNDNLFALKYLHEKGCPWSVETCAIAATKGNLECLEYLRANGCPWDSSTFTKALDYLLSVCRNHKNRPRNRNKRWNRQMLIEAIQGFNQPECISYAWKNGCPWPEGTCLTGLGDGRMDCLLSEPDHDCKWDSETFKGYAAIMRKKKSFTSVHITSLLINCNLGGFETIFTF